MIRVSTALAVLACFCGATCSAVAQQDDSTWINTGIADALQNGQTSYTVPAGTYILQNPIVIPKGVNNFALKGAGSGQTILTTPNAALSALIVVGWVPVLYNNWGITELNNYPVSAVKSGSSTIYVPTNTNIQVGNRYVLWDTHVEWVNNARVTDVMNHAEITKVTNYNAATGAVTLDKATGRSYDSTAELCDCSAVMDSNITVSGFGMNGQVTGSTSASSSLLQVGLVDNVTVTDMAVTNFLSGALLFINSRNVNISNCNLSNATATGAGEGYGYTIERCRYVTINNCSATNMYQGYICHSGAMDVTIENSSCSSCDFDCHGMDERRISYLYDNGNVTGLQVGNQAWPEGDQSITITGCNFMYGINICAYVNGLSASKTSFGRIYLYSDLAGVTNPAWNQYATNVSFTGCSFTAPHDTIFECEQLGTMKFSNCSFESTQTTWGDVIQLKEMNARSLQFSSCTFKDDCGYIAFVLSTNGTNANINVKSSTFISEGGGAYAAQVQSTFLGTASFTNNSFNSVGGSNPSFLLNQSVDPNITSTGNTAQST